MLTSLIAIHDQTRMDVLAANATQSSSGRLIADHNAGGFKAPIPLDRLSRSLIEDHAAITSAATPVASWSFAQSLSDACQSSDSTPALLTLSSAA